MAALGDLGTYPSWLSLVLGAERDPAAAPGNAVWLVTLRARLGPLARSKRLRMKRTSLEDKAVRFEREETDGRNHSAWTLEATIVSSDDTTCDVEVHLHYGGALWSTPLEIVLTSFEGTAADRLSNYLATGD